MKKDFMALSFLLAWVVVGIHRLNQKDYIGVFVSSCVILLLTTKFFYDKIKQELNK